MPLEVTGAAPADEAPLHDADALPSTPTWRSCSCSTRSTRSTRRGGRSLETMPKGYVGALDEREARVFADALAEQTAEAPRRRRFVEHRDVRRGRADARSSSPTPSIAETAIAALAAVERAASRRSASACGTRESTGVTPPPPAWDWHASRYQSDDVIVTYERDRRRLMLVDLVDRSGDLLDGVVGVVAAVGARGAVPRRARPLARAARVTCSCTAGRSATTRSRCCSPGRVVRASRRRPQQVSRLGLTTLGDDYVVLDPDGAHAHALYRSSGSNRRARPSARSTTARSTTRGKLHGAVRFGRRLAVAQRASGSAWLPRPCVGSAQRTTTVTEIGSGTALKALAPTSLVQLDPRADALRRMRSSSSACPATRSSSAPTSTAWSRASAASSSAIDDRRRDPRPERRRLVGRRSRVGAGARRGGERDRRRGRRFERRDGRGRRRPTRPRHDPARPRRSAQRPLATPVSRRALHRSSPSSTPTICTRPTRSRTASMCCARARSTWSRPACSARRWTSRSRPCPTPTTGWWAFSFGAVAAHTRRLAPRRAHRRDAAARRGRGVVAARPDGGLAHPSLGSRHRSSCAPTPIRGRVSSIRGRRPTFDVIRRRLAER